MTYVNVLQCEADETRHYTGATEDLRARLADHNSGKVPHTAKFKPWRLQTYIAFGDKERAYAFERYLKSHSGRAFATKHF
jgi:predicted GIY-YIG superfamily endonuclease